MNKIIKGYRCILFIFSILLFVTILINLISHIRFDRLNLSLNQVLTNENEFEQAIENEFMEFKKTLLEKNIVLDNIEYQSDESVKFDINQNMYLNQISEFLKFLKDIPNLRINKIDIIKNNLDYNLNISAEI